MKRFSTEEFWTPSKLEEEIKQLLEKSTMGITGNSYIIESKVLSKFIEDKMSKAFAAGRSNMSFETFMSEL